MSIARAMQFEFQFQHWHLANQPAKMNGLVRINVSAIPIANRVAIPVNTRPEKTITMTVPKQSSAEKLFVVELIRELDRLITQLRTTTRAADEMAERGNTLAFRELAAVISELSSHVTRSPSKNVTDCHSTIGDEVSGLSVQALANCDLTSLRELLVSADNSIRAWSPAPYVKPERPRLVLGDDETAFAEWKKDADALTALGRPEREAREKIMTAVSAILELLDSARRNQAIGQVTEDSTYSIRRQPSGAFLVKFGNEIGTIEGAGAIRLVQLIRFKRLGVEYLFGTTSGNGLRNKPPQTNEDSIQEFQKERPVPMAIQLEKQDFGNLRNQIKLQLEEIEVKLAHCKSKEAKADLERIQTQLEKYRNGFWRVPDSDIQKHRKAVERSFARLADDCRDDMPLFSQHILTCWGYDEVTDEYDYKHDDAEAEWLFPNF